MSDMNHLNHNNKNEHPDFNEISGEENILVRGVAFAMLVAHQQVNGAASALESLQSDPDFGSSAMRVLHSNQGNNNQ
ncbi:hypothetical protein KQ941_18765 [Paenibacillus xylanexedens]|uniref:hypothetical protein n=1 Tax=Paenibacillus xylanexedens TaxID=528191 RepID=UPI001F3B8E75|nr:hypothetical protein [Paenibacillus xylanexedens]MCF7756489.1 hypothetical protein [Paenibacillus xylanexedens]